MITLITTVLSLVFMYLKNKDPKWRHEFSESLDYFYKGLITRDGSIVTLEFDKLRKEAGVNLSRSDSGTN